MKKKECRDNKEWELVSKSSLSFYSLRSLCLPGLSFSFVWRENGEEDLEKTWKGREGRNLKKKGKCIGRQHYRRRPYAFPLHYVFPLLSVLSFPISVLFGETIEDLEEGNVGSYLDHPLLYSLFSPSLFSLRSQLNAMWRKREER